MHELAIAESVVEIALAHARGRRVTRIELRVGHLRQVVPSALSFGVELLARGTPAEGAELACTTVPAAGRCRDCGADGPLAAFPLACPACGSTAIDVTAGEELRVESIEVEEPEPDGKETRA
jgi:hydrogenase nickel incorporation protein HypA/HybF